MSDPSDPPVIADGDDPESDSAAASVEERSAGRAERQWRIQSFLPVAILIGIVALFSILSDVYFTADNLANIAEQSAVLIVVALGMTFVILAGSIDLSVGAVAGLAAVVMASLVVEPGSDSALVHGDIGMWAVLAGLAVGALAGLINGLLFAVAKVPSFIVTLGMLTIASGLILVYTNGQPQPIASETIASVGSDEVAGVPLIFVIAIAVYLVCLAINRRTVLGRQVYAVGGGERVARLSGVPVRRVKIIVFVLAGSLAAIAGMLLAARNIAGSPTMGAGLELTAIAAVVLGGTPLTGGVGGHTGTVIGALIITALNVGLNVTGVSPNWQDVVIGAVLITAVVISVDRKTIGIIK